MTVHDDSAFEIHRQGQVRLAKGRISFLDGHEAMSAFQPLAEESVSTQLGTGTRFAFTGRHGDIKIHLNVDVYTHLPNSVVMQCLLENTGTATIKLSSITVPTLELDAAWAHELWTMQGAAIHWGQDFAFKLPAALERDNYLGHVQSGEGGGIPIVYFWNQAGGLSLAHIEPTQELWYMPVSVTKAGVHVAFEDRRDHSLASGEIFQSPHVMLSIHDGDFFEPLKLYREALTLQGVKAPEPNQEDYASAWCSWGYEFDVQPSEVTGILPKVSEFGIHWLTLDDRWFDHYGDWNPREDTFPNGVNELK